MPPLLAAAEMLASPVANRTIPQASALPILGLVVAGPAATGPFMLKATGASTGPWPRAQPAINAAQDNASTKLFNMASPSLAARFCRLVGLAHLRTRSRDAQHALEGDEANHLQDLYVQDLYPQLRRGPRSKRVVAWRPRREERKLRRAN